MDAKNPIYKESDTLLKRYQKEHGRQDYSSSNAVSALLNYIEPNKVFYSSTVNASDNSFPEKVFDAF